MNNWQKWLGIVACICTIIACFMHWAYYPDVNKFFTGFDSLVNYKGRMVHYYGRPGFIFCFFAGCSLVLHVLPQLWAKRVNLFFAALCAAWAIKCYFTFTSAYVGNVPVKAFGIFFLMAAATINLIMVIMVKAPTVNKA